MLPKAIVGPQAGTGVKETEERERERIERRKAKCGSGAGARATGGVWIGWAKPTGRRLICTWPAGPDADADAQGAVLARGSRLALCGHGDDGASVPIFAFARIGIGDRDWDCARAGGTSQGQ